MGAFDHLRDQKGVEWQTKYFDCPHQNYYQITDAGKLEIGVPLHLSNEYMEYPIGILESVKHLSIGGAEWAWEEVQFSGLLRAIRCETENTLQKAIFEFQDENFLNISLSK